MFFFVLAYVNAMNTQEPTFLCIGLPKTGTTWLYTQLKQHPRVFLPYKEINYLWKRVIYPGSHTIARFFDTHWVYQRYRNSGKHRLLGYIVHPLHIFWNFPLILWNLKFFFLPYSDQWYCSLFRTSSHCISGDISPIYHRLSDDEVTRIKGSWPDIKILILLRNPIERAWSHAKMALLRNRETASHPPCQQDFYGYFRRLFKRCPSYTALIDRWSRHFPEQQIHVNFYERLVDDPWLFLTQISEFLGLDVGQFPRSTVEQLSDKVSLGLSLKRSEEYSVYLARLYQDCINDMCERYAPYPQQWAEMCSLLLNNHSSYM